MKTLSLALFAVMLTAPVAHAQMSHSMDHSNMSMGDEMLEGAVHTKAIVNSFGEGTANVSHEPIPEIGWPAMTMDLAVMPEARLMEGIAAGDEVILMLIKGDNGMYAIAAMMPE